MNHSNSFKPSGLGLHTPVASSGIFCEVAAKPTEAAPVDALIALGRWLDESNSHRDPEAMTVHRLFKLTEEAGEVASAYIGAKGVNPRKGVTNGMDEVLEELLDVAVTALGAYEHLQEYAGNSMRDLDAKIFKVARRAGVMPADLSASKETTSENTAKSLTNSY